MNEKKQGGFKITWVIVALIAALLLCLLFIDFGSHGQKLTQDQVESVVVGEFKDNKGNAVPKAAFIMFKEGKGYIILEGSEYDINQASSYSDFYFEYDVGDKLWIDYLRELCRGTDEKPNSVSWAYARAGVSFWDILVPILYVGFAIFVFWMLWKMLAGANKGAMQFGKTKVKSYTMTKVRFSDIAGMDEEKAELAEVVEFLRNPKKFTDLGARIPKGVLLVGQPGTGKTLLARAVAGESKVPFISISGSDFVEMFVGVGASRVRDLFDQAKKNKPCIVFIDEIDAVGRQRGAGLGGGNDEREQTLNQLLVEMDGFEPNEGIIVLAATNRSDVLDPALMRPGRFDRQVYVNIPDVKGREGIIKIHSKNKPLDDNIDFKTLAKITVGFTGADIENMLNEAAILAARANRPKIIMSDITEGINKVTMGPQKKSRLITEKDKKITAYHEAGHAILGKKLQYCDEIQEVSIIPRGMAGGYTMQRPDNDNSHRSYNYLMDEIAMCMGGRIAEEIIFKDITTGAVGDINQATKIAHDMIYRYGMSKNLGFLSLDSSQQVFIGRDYQTKNEFSEKLAAEADDEIRNILEYNYKRAKKILNDNVNLLHEMVKLLFARETINKDEVDMLMEGKSSEEIQEIMEKRDKEQREKEVKLQKEREEKELLLSYERKVKEGEKLLASGIITKEEYQAIKDEFERYKNPQQEMKKTEEKPTVEKKIVEKKTVKKVTPKKTDEEKIEKPKRTRIKKDDGKGE